MDPYWRGSRGLLGHRATPATPCSVAARAPPWAIVATIPVTGTVNLRHRHRQRGRGINMEAIDERVC